jgi:hypothetical protein
MILSPRTLFLSFLGLGLVTGLFVGNLSETIATPSAKSFQQNTLIVLVDDLTSENPALEGIWLAARTEGNDTINWEPIYPVRLTEADEEYGKPHSAFYLPGADFDNPSALPPLRSKGIWWNDVFWIDEAALGALQTANGQTPSSLSDAWVEPQAALYEQVQILSAICQTTFSGSQVLDQVLALTASHIRSSISPFELITRWDAWSQNGFSLSCNHPWAE